MTLFSGTQDLRQKEPGDQPSLLKMHRPRNLSDMKLGQDQLNGLPRLGSAYKDKALNKTNFKELSDNDLMCGEDGARHRRIPVQKRKANFGNVVSSSDESEKANYTTPYIQKKRYTKRLQEQRMVTVSQKQVDAFHGTDPMLQTSLHETKKAIIQQIKSMEFKEPGDLKFIRDGLNSKQDFKILCACVSLQRVLHYSKIF